MIAVASAPPSFGSVPPPASSSSTSAGSASALSIATTFAMCAENVLRLSAIDCSSPMSANTLWKTGTCEPSAAGMSSPACAMIGSSPAVLSATVLPPVFGPVITSTCAGGTSTTSTGVTSVPRSMSSGCRAARSSSRPSPRDRGQHAVDLERVARLGLHDVERRRRVDRAAAGLAARPERIRQREQDAADLLLLLLLERDDVVVDLDGAQRLEKQARAARRSCRGRCRESRCGFRRG